MYLWVLLITFLSLLYSYNLSVRGDERKIEIEPLAEAAISSFAIHHRMGQQYIREKSPKSTTNPWGTDEEFIFIPSVLAYNDDDDNNNNDLAQYTPVGFQINVNYKTEVYCAQKVNWNL